MRFGEAEREPNKNQVVKKFNQILDKTVPINLHKSPSEYAVVLRLLYAYNVADLKSVTTKLW